MIIESIELEHVGPFRNKGVHRSPACRHQRAGGSERNREKAPLCEPLARALFDKHTCKDDEIRSLQPAGSELAPQITVVFEHGGNRYRVRSVSQQSRKPLERVAQQRLAIVG